MNDNGAIAASLATAMNDTSDDDTREIEAAINSDKTEEVRTYHMIVMSSYCDTY